MIEFLPPLGLASTISQLGKYVTKGNTTPWLLSSNVQLTGYYGANSLHHVYTNSCLLVTSHAPHPYHQ